MANFPATSAESPASVEAWLEFLNRFKTIVLVANSPLTDVEALKRSYGDDCLFVFFNTVIKILDDKFSHAPCVLVTRSGPKGAALIRRKHAREMIDRFASSRFEGVINIRAADDEVFSPVDDFPIDNVGFLDLTNALSGVYPQAKKATTGFAFAYWLIAHGLKTPLVLAGFSKTRKIDFDWRHFEGHDWYFESIVEQAMVATGKLQKFEGVDERQSALRTAFQKIGFDDPTALAVIIGQANQDQTNSLSEFVDRLWRLTKTRRKLSDLRKSMSDRLRGR